MFRRILIANRGEIACRIARTARALGVETVAVYSDADARAAHVAAADAALRIGPPPVRESYLDAVAIIRAAKDSGAEAVHPGYGFLSENAEFAERCEAADIVFIGPPPAAIRAMGAKHRAKALMEQAGVPVVPGFHGDDQDDAVLREAAARIGFPVLIKASAGGGGKGMRLVERPADFGAALEGARREAASAFGDTRVLIERYMTRPRHIEVQVFADRHGQTVHLFERDCSLQRRHQKVIEEAPAPGMTAALRAHIGGIAVRAAKAVGYVGAGTVEFIADASQALRPDGIWFMEMNTRLQVEHPVTEAVTGLDLVEWQLRVAAGEPLPKRQDAIQLRGHAVEARLYAEDPQHGFLPSTGKLERFAVPGGVRVDSGVREGDEITAYYDPMIAKVIAHAANREAAVAKLADALAAAQVAGLRNNCGFLVRALRQPEFRSGGIDTHFIARHEAGLVTPPPLSPGLLAAAAQLLTQAPSCGGDDPWGVADSFRLAGEARRMVEFIADGERLSVRLDGAGEDIDAQAVRLSNGDIAVMDGGDTYVLKPHDALSGADAVGDTAGNVHAPMPGRIIKVHVAPGQAVRRGDPLLVMEAMKMEHTLAAPSDATVESVMTAVGEQVTEGSALVHFAEEKA